MSYLGRKGAVAPLTSADIPVGIVEGTDIAFLENASGTQNLGGTYSTERMYLNDSYTLTGDVTITGHLALGTVADSDVVITDDGSTRTITGSGTLETGELMPKRRETLTGMTGELGSAVTGSPAITISSAVTGFTGVKNVSLWRVTSDWTMTTSSWYTSPITNWEKDDTYAQGSLGSDMIESSGNFTFPTTGIWEVRFCHNWQITGDIRFTTAHIMVSANGTNYSSASSSRSLVIKIGNSSTFNHNIVWKIIDVADTALNKVNFKVDMQTNATADVLSKGSSSENLTYAVFTRLGDR